MKENGFRVPDVFVLSSATYSSPLQDSVLRISFDRQPASSKDLVPVPLSQRDLPVKKRAETLQKLEAECESLLTAGLDEAADHSKPVIAAWGLVKAGKSSLLNMLSGNVETEIFKTGAVRTTTRNFEVTSGQYRLMDTPGLGIKDRDNKQAYKGLNGADMVLFVHAPPGELDVEEMALLATVKEAYQEETERRLVVVVTQLDKDQDGAVEQVRQRIVEQLKSSLGISPCCFAVSNTRYQKGMRRELSAMIKSSGISALTSHLDDLTLAIANQVQIDRSQRRTSRKTRMLRDIEQAIADEQHQLMRAKQTYVMKARAFNRLMTDLRDGFAARTGEIRDTNAKLKHLQE